MPESYLVFGQVEADLNKGRYTAAMMKLTRLSNTYSNDLYFLGLLAQTQRSLSDFDGLIKTLSVTAKITQSPPAFLDLMLILYTQGRLNEALDIGLLLQETELTDSQEKALVHCLIRIYMEFSDYEGIQEVAAAYKGGEQDTLIVWALGLVQLATGNKNEALSLFRESVELNVANDHAWVSLALLHEEMGDRELALANLERALDVNPQNATGLKLMTKWYRRQAEQTNYVMGKVRYYLSQHEFDEEMSLCYVQMLKENNLTNMAGFEIDKLILHNPANSQYRQLKKNLEDGLKI